MGDKSHKFCEPAALMSSPDKFMKAFSCPQCGGLIKHILPRQPIAECDYCGAELMTGESSAQPESFAVEAAKFRPPAPPVQPRQPMQPVYFAISCIGIFVFLLFLLFLLSFLPSKSRSAALPNSPVNVNKYIEPELADLSKIPTVSYCGLVKNPAFYDKKIIRLRAIYFNFFEKTYLYDATCEPNQPPSAPEKVPAETWAQWDKSFVSDGDSVEAKTNRHLNRFGRSDVTVIGRFDSTNEQGDKGAPNLFGHLNCCRYQFSIMKLEQLDSDVK
jgi:hypothetical protein